MGLKLYLKNVPDQWHYLKIFFKSLSNLGLVGNFKYWPLHLPLRACAKHYRMCRSERSLLSNQSAGIWFWHYRPLDDASRWRATHIWISLLIGQFWHCRFWHFRPAACAWHCPMCHIWMSLLTGRVFGCRFWLFRHPGCAWRFRDSRFATSPRPWLACAEFASYPLRARGQHYPDFRFSILPKITISIIDFIWCYNPTTCFYTRRL